MRYPGDYNPVLDGSIAPMRAIIREEILNGKKVHILECGHQKAIFSTFSLHESRRCKVCQVFLKHGIAIVSREGVKV